MLQPLYTEKEKKEIERIKAVFQDHLDKSEDYDLVWSDKVGYVLLSLPGQPQSVDSAEVVCTAVQLCYQMFYDIAMDVLIRTRNDHVMETADPLEIAEIKRCWKPYKDQLPEYAYLCEKLLSSK